MNSVYADTLASIIPISGALTEQVQAHLDSLTKPQGSLGRLEEIAMRYCCARGETHPAPGRMRICCFAGDHGVVAEGVSAFPKEVTPQMVLNIVGGGAAVSVLARHVGAELRVVDIGVDADLAEAPGLLIRKVRRGTGNIARGPAMSRAEAVRAIEIGIGLAHEAAREGVVLLGTGEMGIGNTTPSTALFAAYLGCAPDAITGRGTGVDEAGMARKIAVIEQALRVNRDWLTSPLDTLAALGGFEIAGICGLILGAASARVPVVVDGFISCAGALAAMQICSSVRDYLFFGHLSHERGHRQVLTAMGVRPVLDLDMRLGEGTGAALAMGVIDGALKVYREMATFTSAGVTNREG